MDIRLVPRPFPDPAPAVSYEVDASDTLVAVNDAWQHFAIENDAAHLLRDRVLGRSLWDFISGETTRLVYDVLLRQVRRGGRSQFQFRCDSAEWRRLMQMTIAPGRAGHVLFQSVTVALERHALRGGETAPGQAPLCGWCQRACDDGRGWLEVGAVDAVSLSGAGAAGSTQPAADRMCADCYRRVVNSVDECTT